MLSLLREGVKMSHRWPPMGTVPWRIEMRQVHKDGLHLGSIEGFPNHYGRSASAHRQHVSHPACDSNQSEEPSSDVTER